MTNKSLKEPGLIGTASEIINNSSRGSIILLVVVFFAVVGLNLWGGIYMAFLRQEVKMLRESHTEVVNNFLKLNDLLNKERAKDEYTNERLNICEGELNDCSVEASLCDGLLGGPPSLPVKTPKKTRPIPDMGGSPPWSLPKN